jgi:hypothetical protein
MREGMLAEPGTLMNIVEYFDTRRRELDEEVAAIESGTPRRILSETAEGTVDITQKYVEQLQQMSKDCWRAAQNLRRINSNQTNSPSPKTTNLG